MSETKEEAARPAKRGPRLTEQGGVLVKARRRIQLDNASVIAWPGPGYPKLQAGERVQLRPEYLESYLEQGFVEIA